MLKCAALLGLLLPLLASGAYPVSNDCVGVNAVRPGCVSNEALYRRDVFYLGGHYLPAFGGNIFVDQLYVEKLVPASGIRQPYPLVFIHGGGISGVTWLQTPDNREGWASWFLEQGYAVYLVDGISVGRSSQQDFPSYPIRIGSTAEIAEGAFTAPELRNDYPQAKLHTQWPGTGLMGDPIFDAYMATFLPLSSNTNKLEDAMRAAGCDLLSRIGPSFLVTHSFGAQFATVITDQCPDLVVGSVNVEPGNIPFQSLIGNSTVPFVGRTPSRPWGLTVNPVTYDPPAAASSDLQTVTVGDDTPGNRSCIVQAEPARKLPNIAKVPYLALTGEASVHITYDRCVLLFLQQAGVKADWIKLADVGIKGNSHFSFQEKNNLQIAAVANKWIMARAAIRNGSSGGSSTS